VTDTEHLKTTQHFEAAIRERGIDRAWCRRVADGPIAREVQDNGRIRLWGYIEEVNRTLRVVLLEDGETFHTADFDRRFRG
jgi:hypothetical protein